MQRLSLFLILTSCLFFISACEDSPSINEQTRQIRQDQQALFLQMINDTDGLGPDGASIDFLEITSMQILRPNEGSEETESWLLRGFNEQEGEGDLTLNLSINSNDVISLREGRFEILSPNTNSAELQFANYRIEQDFQEFERMSFRHPDENIDSEFFVVSLFQINTEEGSIIFNISQNNTEEILAITLNW